MKAYYLVSFSSKELNEIIPKDLHQKKTMPVKLSQFTSLTQPPLQVSGLLCSVWLSLLSWWQPSSVDPTARKFGLVTDWLCVRCSFFLKCKEYPGVSVLSTSLTLRVNLLAQPANILQSRLSQVRRALIKKCQVYIPIYIYMYTVRTSKEWS